MRATSLGLYCACFHLLAFIVVLLCINTSLDPQAPLLWGGLAIIDFPISLLYFCMGTTYSAWLDSYGTDGFAYLLYGPYLIHGIFGTFWWFFLPRLVTPRRIGGVWGKGNRGHVSTDDK